MRRIAWTRLAMWHGLVCLWGTANHTTYHVLEHVANTEQLFIHPHSITPSLRLVRPRHTPFLALSLLTRFHHRTYPSLPLPPLPFWSAAAAAGITTPIRSNGSSSSSSKRRRPLSACALAVDATVHLSSRLELQSWDRIGLGLQTGHTDRVVSHFAPSSYHPHPAPRQTRGRSAVGVGTNNNTCSRKG